MVHDLEFLGLFARTVNIAKRPAFDRFDVLSPLLALGFGHFRCLLKSGVKLLSRGFSSVSSSKLEAPLLREIHYL